MKLRVKFKRKKKDDWDYINIENSKDKDQVGKITIIEVLFLMKLGM